MAKGFRPPAVPLVTHDPYFSIWSCADALTDDYTRHWTGSRCAMTGFIRIDGEWRRFIGRGESDAARYRSHEMDALRQTGCTVMPTSTVYTFECEQITLEVTFCSPVLANDIALMSRPISYVSYKIGSRDGAEHEIEVYFDISAEAAVNTPDQSVKFGHTDYSVYCGRGNTDVLAKRGDDLRIDWGYLHLFGNGFEMHTLSSGARSAIIGDWGYGELAYGEEVAVGCNPPVLALMKDYRVGENSAVSDFFCVGYDDIHSIEYMHRQLDAYWRKDGAEFADIARDALANYAEITARAERFDSELMSRARAVSDKYADIIATAYRQTVAAHKAVYDGEKVLFLSKECYSNGSIGTVDVTYPSIPLFLMINPELVCGMLDPIFEFAATDRWKFDYSPHDVGQYPLANGHWYSTDMQTGEVDPNNQMPIEECGNMLLCTAAVCEALGSAQYAAKNEALLTQWADYLLNYGFDPENQLCTDDFAGHLAHNCNLSAKAILGIAAWGKLLTALGRESEAERYTSTARDFAAKWKKEAFDGDHYRLAFDQPNTWSIKYNLVWDKLLGLNIFDSDIFETESAYYLNRMNKYGLPLDSRRMYTKSDWQMWATVLSDGDLSDRIIDAMWDMLNETPDRVPFTDWYETESAEQVVYGGPLNRIGFQNRTVQGGLFIRMMK